jgi:hypothetical protein
MGADDDICKLYSKYRNGQLDLCHNFLDFRANPTGVTALVPDFVGLGFSQLRHRLATDTIYSNSPPESN